MCAIADHIIYWAQFLTRGNNINIGNGILFPCCADYDRRTRHTLQSETRKMFTKWQGWQWNMNLSTPFGRREKIARILHGFRHHLGETRFLTFWLKKNGFGTVFFSFFFTFQQLAICIFYALEILHETASILSSISTI